MLQRLQAFLLCEVAKICEDRDAAEDERYDPAQQLPLDVPVWCVHGEDDAIVPIGQSESYVRRATAAGARWRSHSAWARWLRCSPARAWRLW
mgnify:CR=1 FL=1